MPKQTRPDRLVCAAGAVLWRDRAGATEVALVHRPRYDDWSLPKGKVDPGEVEPVTAVRELLEETGHHAELGRFLITVTYPLTRATKRVRYWAARETGGRFSPNDEVDELAWLPAPDALDRLGYTTDRKVLRAFLKQPAHTRTVLIVRHGTAGSRRRFTGDDTLRPLDKKGRAQAAALVELLCAFGATEVHAADRVRCHQTVAPLAERLGVPVGNEPSLTEEAYARDPRQARRRVLQIAGVRDGAAAPSTPVICTQGKVIPDLIAWWCERDGVKVSTSGNRKGSTWVLSLAGDRLIAADHLPSPLAADASG
ncbi:NUDIX hydrolase [Mycolicibacillus trivialis]